MKPIDDVGSYRVVLPFERPGAQVNLQGLIAKGLTRTGAEQLLAGRRVTNMIDVRNVERLAASRQLTIETTSRAGAPPGIRVVPSQVKVIIMG